MDTPIKMDDLGVPLFLETPKYTHKFSFLFSNQKTHLSVCCFVFCEVHFKTLWGVFFVGSS